MLSFNPKGSFEEKPSTYSSVRDLFGTDECVYVMDAKSAGNIGRFLNVSRFYQFLKITRFVKNIFIYFYLLAN